METTKYLVYYNEEKQVIGIRPHHFDWKEGQDIQTNGIRTTIFAIFDATENNVELADDMMVSLKKNTPRRGSVQLTRSEYGCSSIRAISKDAWKSFDAELDFVDEVLAKMD